MLFNTSAFGVFFVLVCVGYWGLARQKNARLGLLLCASYYFYACWDVSFLLLIGGVTVIDYVAALVIARLEDRRARLYVVAVAIGLNFGLLGYWKYAGFFLESLAPLFQLMSIHPIRGLDIILPVGISFFTFQGLSYLVDVYRGDIEAERSLFRFALYIAFFPQLVAGPIVRARDLLHQLDKPVDVSRERCGRGLGLILLGLVKKIVMADYLAANLIVRVFDLPSHFGSLEVLGAMYGYSLQIYGDFSGYTDIAIGAALLLGFKLPANFDSPYRATDLRDFWRRWHISLSTWLRDYLYISMGGSRSSRAKTYRNLMVTMILGGLWHGASYKFVIWGALHGLVLAIAHVVDKRRKERAAKRWPRWLRIVLTFHLVTALWVFFRADTFSAALAMFGQLFAFVPGISNLTLPLVALIVLGYLTHIAPDRWHEKLMSSFSCAPAFTHATATIAVLYLTLGFAQTGAQPFIYFQF